MRLFFALWPDPPLRRELSSLIDRLKSTQQARWIDAAKLHLTLAFLGEQPAARLPQLEEVGVSMQTPGGALLLDRLELWRRPGVLCLVPQKEPTQLLSLNEDLSQRLRQAGFDLERRAFRPHLTLARRASTCPDYDLSRHPALEWSAKALTLCESRQDNGDSRYQILRAWHLPN
jgi:2'-5' RNA ligase